MLRDDNLNDVDYARIRRNRDADFRAENFRHEGELFLLENIIHRETEENGGINVDHAIVNRNHQRRHERLAARRAAIRHHAINNALRERNAHEVVNNEHEVLNLVVIPRAVDLAQLANDRQNVHTALVVTKVKETVQLILQIHVPREYETDTLKTPGEIILGCNLSKQGAWQMMAKYCNDADIYELGEGIYARVLNSVWQFIKLSPDSEDLKKILRSEMEDNIGMCAQGNLSRVCNILSGYVDGINADVKSRNEIIGERFSALMIIDDAEERARHGNAILEELGVPPGERMDWLGPLIDA
jgi:hypothetical protein